MAAKSVDSSAGVSFSDSSLLVDVDFGIMASFLLRDILRVGLLGYEVDDLHVHYTTPEVAERHCFTSQKEPMAR